MALTLPNNLVFVPLDVLTAEELNQLMANDTFLANQFPIASGNIGANAVKKQNIDWSTVAQVTTNTSGTAIAYPDGRKIQFGTVSKNLNINIPYEGQNFAGFGSVTFPVPFTSTPTVVTDARNASSLLGSNVSALGTTSFETYIWKQEAKSNVTVDLSWIAIGI